MLVIGINAKIGGSICIVTDGGNILAESMLPTMQLGKIHAVDGKKLTEWLAQAFTHIDWPGICSVQTYIGYPPLIPSYPDLKRAFAIGTVVGVLAAFPGTINHIETSDTAHEIALKGLTMSSEGTANVA